jgi:hypothetical protein
MSQGPALTRQGAVDLTSGGHVAEVPEHFSAGSQMPFEPLHVTPALPGGWVHVALEPLQMSAVQMMPSSVHPVFGALKPLAGQVVPLQISAKSHSPCAARHCVLAGTAKVKSHAPLTQRSCVQGLVSAHPVHAAPLAPHWPADWLPIATQVLPDTQPVQQTLPTHAPLGHSVPSPTLVCVHVPPPHESVVQGFPSSQLLQEFPLLPQVLTEVPLTQAPPLQQLLAPEQQVDPQHEPEQQDVPQQSCPAWQHKPLQQGPPLGHVSPGMQNACCSDETGSGGPTSVEQDEIIANRARSAAVGRRQRPHSLPRTSIVGLPA